jgi:hypothetical protein
MRFSSIAAMMEMIMKNTVRLQAAIEKILPRSLRLMDQRV